MLTVDNIYIQRKHPFIYIYLYMCVYFMSGLSFTLDNFNTVDCTTMTGITGI